MGADAAKRRSAALPAQRPAIHVLVAVSLEFCVNDRSGVSTIRGEPDGG
jgi:hypothetical protein